MESWRTWNLKWFTSSLVACSLCRKYFGSEFHSELNSNNIDKTIFKGNNPEIDSYSAFFDNGKLQKTNLDNFLKEKEIDTLYIMGLATDFCVKFTVLDALELGYKVYFNRRWLQRSKLNS